MIIISFICTMAAIGVAFTIHSIYVAIRDAKYINDENMEL
jgi:hypothetical protein